MGLPKPFGQNLLEGDRVSVFFLKNRLCCAACFDNHSEDLEGTKFSDVVLPEMPGCDTTSKVAPGQR